MPRKPVCVDLDGVLADYVHGWKGIDEFGDPIPGAVEFTKELATFADIVIYTCRCSEDMGRGLGKALLKKYVKEWLDKHGFVYHEIYTGQGKPYAAAYIDDRSVACRPQSPTGQMAFWDALSDARFLCGVAVKQDRLPGEENETRLPDAIRTDTVQAVQEGQ